MREPGLGLLLLAACSGASSSGPDATPACWPGSSLRASAAVGELGTGLSSFEPVETDQDMEVVAGPQGGFHFFLHARAQGLDPGDPDSIGGDNPRTLFSIFRESGEEIDVLECPFSYGLVEEADGFAYLPMPVTVIFRQDVVADLDGQRLRVVLEMVDAEENYIEDERWVIAQHDI